MIRIIFCQLVVLGFDMQCLFGFSDQVQSFILCCVGVLVRRVVWFLGWWLIQVIVLICEWLVVGVWIRLGNSMLRVVVIWLRVDRLILMLLFLMFISICWLILVVWVSVFWLRLVCRCRWWMLLEICLRMLGCLVGLGNILFIVVVLCIIVYILFFVVYWVVFYCWIFFMIFIFCGFVGMLLLVGLLLIVMVLIQSGVFLVKSMFFLVGVQGIMVLWLFFVVLILLLFLCFWCKCLSL